MTEQGPLAQVDALATGYREAQILFTAIRLRLFDHLQAGPLDAEQLAEAVGGDPRGTRILADALVALDLLDKRSGRYCNREVAETCLTSDGARSRIGILLHGARLYAKWGGLFDAVVGGAPVPDEAIAPELRTGARDFASAMRDVGVESVRPFAEAVDLSEVRHLLDLGGGPGVYAVALATRYPGLAVTLFDRPETAEVARENIATSGMEGRVKVRGGNAFHDDLGGPYDFALLSNVVHIYSGEENRRLVAHCGAHLAPGGRLCLKDFFLEDDRTTPQGAAIFAVNMLVNTASGDCHTCSEAQSWLTDAGLLTDPVVELTPQTRLILGRKE